MTVTLRLRDDVEAGLLAQAQATGMTLEEYLLAVVEGAAGGIRQEANRTAESTRREAVRQMLEFGEKHQLSLGEPITRRLLHEGHRF